MKWPELAPGTFSDTLARRRRRTRESAHGFSLTLTPLIDCFSILVIFLLHQLANDPTAMETGEYQFLPKAKSVVALQPAITLVLQKDGLFLNKQSLGSLAEIRLSPEKFKTHLNAGAAPEAEARVTLQADAELPSSEIAEILARLSAAGYPSVQLAVTSEGQEP